MRQLTFKDLKERPREPAVRLEARIAEELVAAMAEAILATLARREEKSNDNRLRKG